MEGGCQWGRLVWDCGAINLWGLDAIKTKVGCLPAKHLLLWPPARKVVSVMLLTCN
jgi:hypothetical protein